MKITKKILIIISLLSTMVMATPVDEYNSTKAPTKNENPSTILKKIFTEKKPTLLKKIAHKKFLRSFYHKNDYAPLWLNEKGLNKKKYTQLFNQIKNDLTLNPKGLIFQHNQQIHKELEGNITKENLYKTELSLTALYYDFLQHSIYGEIQWKNFTTKLSSLKRYKINAAWRREKPKFNLTKLLSQPDINQTITEVTPKNFGYASLLVSLKRLHKLKEQGGWKELPYFKRLELGSTGDMVIQLRHRLMASSDLGDCNNSTTTPENNETIKIDKNAIFGECLDRAVKKFQKRHGLVVDGIVGGGTRKVLNITVDEKIRTVLLNIDRIKWLPRDEKERYIIVNIPEFMLYYIEDKKIKKRLKVIVGDKRHPTPIFNQKISYIVLNPYWKVPEGIVRREIVPQMIKNPNYLRRQGLQAHTTWSEGSPIVDVSGLYWEEYLTGGKRFPYRLMQPPGPRNALGKIKFKFPNRFAVYLHDTPTRYLFKRNTRAFSHGCVRLSNPVELLETIATFNEGIDLAHAKKILKGKKKHQLNVKTQLPINLIYLTAGINENNELEFRDDIYRYDKFMKRSIH
jgi:murein L,D-transpeptidase YcbB/YkuD